MDVDLDFKGENKNSFTAVQKKIIMGLQCKIVITNMF